MGTKIPLPDPIDGDDCIDCFPAGETPKFIFAMFWDVLKGDKVGAREPPNGHLFTMIQDDIAPCLWKNDIGTFGWDVQLQYWPVPPHGVILRLILYGSPVQPYFSCDAGVLPVEHLVFDNALWDPPITWGYNGHGIILWLDAARQVIEDFVLPTDPKILMEFFTTEEGVAVYKFCLRKYGMNVKLLMSP